MKSLISLCSGLSKLNNKEKVIVVVKDDKLLPIIEAEGELLASSFNINHLIFTTELPNGFGLSFKVDYEAIEAVFGSKTPAIVAKVATLSYESIKRNLLDSGLLKVVIDNAELAVPREFFVEDFKKVDGFGLVEFTGGYIIYSVK